MSSEWPPLKWMPPVAEESATRRDSVVESVVTVNRAIEVATIMVVGECSVIQNVVEFVANVV